ncbi:unnamed protein product [Dibothriocephalus latus]|uniref:Fibronectin type-III domain-containing protein n=1 Tax=Dibothriocephalus latus TaxID=60516 RepID=A0A3P7LP34_DIBLA|nr:unnamed protein product [Dibothriocephalus latus]
MEYREAIKDLDPETTYTIITWGPPLQKSLKPSSYIVRVGPKINIIQAEDLTGSSTLTGLQPDTRYGVSVEISYKHTNYRPPAVETNVRTEPAEEPEPFVPEPEIDSDEAEIYDDEADFYDDEEAIDNDEP